MKILRIFTNLGYLFVSYLLLTLFNGCEPSPKMVTYGSNEYSQLDFDGTGFDYSPLEGSYIEAWAGKNFSIARVGNENPNQDQDGPGTLSPGLYCKGDNSMGQCDFPDTLFSDVAGGRFHKMIRSDPFCPLENANHQGLQRRCFHSNFGWWECNHPRIVCCHDGF